MARKITGTTIFLVFLIVFMLTGLSSISRAGEAEIEKKKGKAPIENTQEKKATLKLVSGSGNKSGIDLTNTVPVRGVQFTVNGVNLTEVRTTSRTASFMAKFNEANGRVILVSLTKDEIAPGKGPIAEIIYEKAPSSGTAIGLSNITMVGRNRERL